MTAKLLTELIGTFFLVLTIGLTVLIGSALAPLAIAGILMTMIYAGGHVSGAHYNPAVTLAVWLRGKMPASEIAPYMAAQIVGAILAAFAAYAVTGDVLQVTPAEETGLGAFFLLELLFTFALVFVILNVATSIETAGNDYFGLAIGLVVLAGALAAGPISGGAFNPAVALGPILVDLFVGEGLTVSGLWVYLVATFAGGALAAFVFRVQSPADAADAS
ncbi:MAG: aquaporin [Bacteroidota bacterium]